MKFKMDFRNIYKSNFECTWEQDFAIIFSDEGLYRNINKLIKFCNDNIYRKLALKFLKLFIKDWLKIKEEKLYSYQQVHVQNIHRFKA